MNLGRYELRNVIGEGGFATVYRAWDPEQGRYVALKALFPQVAAHEITRERFLAETTALSVLRHPNIVTFLDAGESGGRPFLVMELVEGFTLAQLPAQGGSLPVERVAAIVSRLGSALDYIHAAGLIHRDLKPANVMLDGGGRVVLMDFGIVRVLDGAGWTRAGSYLGTPEYTSPEQIRNQPLGPAADIYALGVLAYQLLAGRPPFQGDMAHVLHAHAHEDPPPLSALRPDLSPAIGEVVAAALAKHPEQRPRSACAFAAALARAVTHAPALIGAGEAAPQGEVLPPPDAGPLAPPGVAGADSDRGAPPPLARQPAGARRRPRRYAALVAGVVLAVALGGVTALLLLGRSTSAGNTAITQVAGAATPPPTMAAATATLAARASPTPAVSPTGFVATASPAPTPRPVTAPTFAVNSQPVGCHTTADAGAAVARQYPIGAVLAMDQVWDTPDGAWHREVAQGCWVRTNPGPVRLLPALAEAEALAASLRPTPSPSPTPAPRTPAPSAPAPDAPAPAAPAPAASTPRPVITAIPATAPPRTVGPVLTPAATLRPN